MLKHDCKECGKRLSETAATCPNCGAPKPPEGWRQVKAPARGLTAAAIAFLCIVSAYALFSGYQHFTGDSAPKIAPGMHFDLDHEGMFLCSSPDRLKKMATYASKGDMQGIKSLSDHSRHDGTAREGGSDFCWTGGMLSDVFQVDKVVNIDELGQVVQFHDTRNSSPYPFYTLASFVKPWEYLVPTSINQNIKPSDIKKSMQFRVYNKEFVACKDPESLAKISRYITEGKTIGDSIDRISSESSDSEYCQGNFSSDTYPDSILIVDEIQNVEGLQDAVVAFHVKARSDKLPDGFYTSIKFINPSSLTPSAAN